MKTMVQMENLRTLDCMVMFSMYQTHLIIKLEGLTVFSQVMTFQ